MPVSDRPSGDEHHEPGHPRRLLPEEEHELERRTRAQLRDAMRGAFPWNRRSPNQRYVAHRRGNR
jgi:hypothetical protein